MPLDPRMIAAAEAGLTAIADRALDERGITAERDRKSFKAIVFMLAYARTWADELPMLGRAPLQLQAPRDFDRALEFLQLEASPHADTDQRGGTQTH